MLYCRGKEKIMPYYPNCNMRTLSEVNMTTRVTTKQDYTMENIMRNESGEAVQYKLNSTLAIIVYQLTEKTDDKMGMMISAGYLQRKKGRELLRLDDKFAVPVTNQTLRKALHRLKLSSDGIDGEKTCLSSLSMSQNMIRVHFHNPL